jgi:hypothetical protein
MVNIKAKREENGRVTHLKSEYGNIFTRDTIIKDLRKGYKFYTLHQGRENNEIYLVDGKDGLHLSIDKKKRNYDKIDDIPTF